MLRNVDVGLSQDNFVIFTGGTDRSRQVEVTRIYAVRIVKGWKAMILIIESAL